MSSQVQPFSRDSCSGTEFPEISAEKYSQLLQLGQIISSEMNMDCLLDQLIVQTNKILGAERSTLFLYDRRTDQLYSMAGTGLRSKEIRINNGQGIAGWVFQHQTPALVHDPYQDSRFCSEIDRYLQFRTRNICCIPLLDRALKSFGVLESLNKNKSEFSEDDQKFLTYISHYAILIIESFNLHQEQQFISIAKERIINHLSHEIRTPLAIIASTFAKISRELHPECRKRLENTINRGQRNIQKLIDMQNKIDDVFRQRKVTERGHMLNFIQDTLDLIQDCSEESMAEHKEILDRITKRIESIFAVQEEQPGNIVLDAFLHELCNTVKTRIALREVTINRIFDENLLIYIDKKILEKSFTGLLKNAIENTPDEGKIDIIARASQNDIRIEVRDYGIGIAEHNQKFVFGGFFHTQDTYLYSSKREYAFNAGGTGSDLLRIKSLSDRSGFAVDLQSSRCRFIPNDRDQCPGRISTCRFIRDRSECFASGGSTFSLIFPKTG